MASLFSDSQRAAAPPPGRRVTLCAAISANGVIGSGHGGLPWHLPEEAASYRAYCQEKCLLLGRVTFEEMSGWFTPGQDVIVLSRSLDPLEVTAARSRIQAASLRVASTVAEALMHEAGPSAPEIVVLGGGQVYQLLLPYATHLRLSFVHCEAKGAVRFPLWNPAEWDEAQEFSSAEWSLSTFTRRGVVIKKKRESVGSAISDEQGTR